MFRLIVTTLALAAVAAGSAAARERHYRPRAPRVATIVGCANWKGGGGGERNGCGPRGHRPRASDTR
jgi:hypothetical protein